MSLARRLQPKLYAALEWALTRERADRLVARCYGGLFNSDYLRRILDGNLRRVIAYSRKREPSKAELDVIVAEAARLYAANEIAAFAMERRVEEFAARTDLELMPALQSLLEGGKGAVLVTPHFGNLSVLIVVLAYWGIPLNVVVVHAGRHRSSDPRARNLRFIEFGEGARPCLDALKRNETVLVIGDVGLLSKGRTADFFGAPFPPPHAAARLALAAGAPILPVYNVCRGGRCRIVNDAPIRVDCGPSQEELESRILRSMEKFIGDYPSHWFVFQDAWNLEQRDKYNLWLLRMQRISLAAARLRRALARLAGLGASSRG